MEINKCSIEFYIDKKFLFPNNYLDEVHDSQTLLVDKKDYNIYFILYGDSYKILDKQENGGILRLSIKNITINKTYFIEMDILASFRVPDCSCLKITLLNGGLALKFEYNEKGVEYLSIYCNSEYKIYKEIMNKYGCFWNAIDAKTFVDLHIKEDNKEKEEKHEVIYIGQSKQDDIFKRLNNHKTLQKIMRDTYKANLKKEIYIMILSFATKQYSSFCIRNYNANLVTANGIDENYRINGSIDKNAMVDIAEALLISYFQPKYNDKLKKREGREKLETYRKIGNAEIDSISITLDLYFEDYNIKLNLESEAENTKTKALIINCIFDKELIINAINFPDMFY